MSRKHSNNNCNYNNYKASNNSNQGQFGSGNIFKNISYFYRCCRRNYFRCRRPTYYIFRWIVFGGIIGVLIVIQIGIPIALCLLLVALWYLLFKC